MSSRKLRFDGWLLDPESGDLKRNGTRIRLQDQPVQVLCELIAHAGSVVTREQLIALLWPKGVVDFDTGLNTVIRKLRSALGDTSETPRYIETLPRRGYRFIGALDLDPEAASTGSTTVPAPTISSERAEPVHPARSQSGYPANLGPSPAAAFAPPTHSIAVLPFVNLSGDKEQEYFSDGLTEELLNSLTHIDGLQVAARTSSFTFREHPDVAEMAHKLNVATVLTGSVRRSGNTVRIGAQLINAVTGFHYWSKTYDRDLGDVLKLQTEIATAVASALEVTLLGDLGAKIELGGTRNPAAFDAYLRALKAFNSGHGASSYQSAIAEYTEAIRLDSNYALAFANRSNALCAYAAEFATGTAVRGFLDRAHADADQAVKLGPELAEGHLALARFYTGSIDYMRASKACQRAIALAPGNAEVLADGGRIAVWMGRHAAGLAAARRAVTLDPLNPRRRFLLASTLYSVRRYEEAVATFGEAIALEPKYKAAYGARGLAYYGRSDFQSARSSCETEPGHWLSQWCLALAYDKLGRHPDAEGELNKLQSAMGDSAAYQYATIYAHWGNRPKALEWLDTAMRLHDPGLGYLKTDPLMDPLRQEPRFQAIAQALKFPD